jgi:hypothetical protein
MSLFRKRPQLLLLLSVSAGIVLALLVCVQCVRTFFYVGRVLIPQEAEREAERQTGALVTAARNAGINNPRDLGPVLNLQLEEAADRVVWFRLLSPDGVVVSQAGAPQGEAKIPAGWFEAVEKREYQGKLVDTPRGKALVALMPFRAVRRGGGRPGGPGRPGLRSQQKDDKNGNAAPANPAPEREPGTEQARSGESGRPPDAPRGGGGGGPRADPLEIAIPLEAVSDSFSGLLGNIIGGMVASLALLAALAVIGLRAPNYMRGKYLEAELAIARMVQHDLLPKPVAVSPHVDFAAAASAAGHVGGDFHDVFETDTGRVAIVLGDVSGKGIPAALLVGVIQGAIRSSSGNQPDTSCERMNRMLCERTAAERYATMFWGIFDPLTATLRYVNAGHAAPILLRAGAAPQHLGEGGPVLGVIRDARYQCGRVQVQAGDTLIVYSDGINEAMNRKEEEFGDDRILSLASGDSENSAQAICEAITRQVDAFSSSKVAQDDRTLLVVRFLKSRAAMTA